MTPRDTRLGSARRRNAAGNNADADLSSCRGWLLGGLNVGIDTNSVMNTQYSEYFKYCDEYTILRNKTFLQAVLRIFHFAN